MAVAQLGGVFSPSWPVDVPCMAIALGVGRSPKASWGPGEVGGGFVESFAFGGEAPNAKGQMGGQGALASSAGSGGGQA